MQFYLVDVFGTGKYSGNQLAVVIADEEIPDSEMRQIAREFNFSETTFVYPRESSEHSWKVRIFTPVGEIPFAGHPTLGTAFVIRNKLQRNGLAADTADPLVLDLPAGDIPVTFASNGLLWMKQIEPRFVGVHEAKHIAHVVNVNPGDIDPRFPVQDVSTGLPFTIIPLVSLDAVRKAETNLRAYREYFSGGDATPLFLFCPETYEPEHHLNCRMFAEEFGITEDPATGSANGCLAGYLVKYRYFGTDEINLQVEQGYEVGRKSILHLRAGEMREPAGAIEVNVGGEVVPVAEGRIL